MNTIPQPLLLIEYFKMNFRNSEIRPGSIKTILADQAFNLHFVLMLYLNIYLVDVVLSSALGCSARRFL